jgi:hypothetical protein
MMKGVIIVLLGMVVFAVIVIAILANNQGCFKLEMGVASFSGKFEHCAFAACQATQSAVLGADVSEDIATAAGNAAAAAAAKSLQEGRCPEEAARDAAAAAFGAAREEGADRDEAFLAARAAGAATAAAAASDSVEDAELVTAIAANVAASGQGAQAAERAALDAGAPESVPNIAFYLSCVASSSQLLI